MPESNCPSDVLYDTFVIKKKTKTVYYQHGFVIWDCEKSHSHHSLSLEDVICVNYNRPIGPNERNNPISLTSETNNCLTLYYGKNSSKSIWKLQTVTFHHSDPLVVEKWVKTLQNYLNGFKHRPKKLLLFVNPFGGKKNAMHVFEKYGKPLFSIAGINVTVVVSQRQNQIRDCILSLDLNIYDSIACVGGDGTFSEVFNGLVMRACKEQNVNIDDIEAELPKPHLPVGIIPAGSTNTIAYCLHGTVNIQTAVLQIIFGNSLGLDLVSVYNENSLLKIYGSVISYGYLGDIVMESEKYRWMGPKRYEFTGFKKFMSNSGYNVELAFCNEEEEREGKLATKCFGSCDICRFKGQNLYYNSIRDWKILKGKFFMVSGANISCACTRSPNGLSPYSHLGDGYVDIILVRHTNLFNNLRLLIRLSSKNKNVSDLPFVEVFRTKEFCFRACQNKSKTNENQVIKSSKWNCDGEIINDTDLRVKVRCQLLNVLSRGSQYQARIASCC